MSTVNPNQTLLQGRNQSPSDTTPAPLTGPSNKVSFLFQGVQPPSELYVGRDDLIFVQVATNQAAETVTIAYRLLEPDGTINPGFLTFPVLAGAAPQSFTLNLAEGYLLSLVIICSAAVQRGQTFVRVYVNRSKNAFVQPGQLLFSDYVTRTGMVGYPGGRQLSPVESAGWIHSITIANPAAGADWVFPLSQNEQVRMIS